MSSREFCIGDCGNCVEAQVLIGRFELDWQQTDASSDYPNDEDILRFMDDFNSYPADEPPPINIYTRRPFANAKQYAETIAKFERANVASHISRVLALAEQFRTVLADCPGPLSAKLFMPDEPEQTLYACASMKRVEEISHKLGC